MTMSDEEVRPFPITPPGQLSPNPLLDELRRNNPVSRVKLPFGSDAWLVTRHADVKLVLSDQRFSRSAAIRDDIPRATPRVPLPSSILSMDPPEHTRLRQLLVKAFTVRRVESLRPRTEAITTGLLDRIERAGPPADLVEDLCLPLPVMVICELLGVPLEDQHNFRAWAEGFVSATRLTAQEVAQCHQNLRDYLAELVARRRRDPGAGTDLLAALLAARDTDGRLTEEELITIGVTLIVAGHETTAGQLGNFTYLLLTEPDKADLLRTQPALIPDAVEEMLRYVPIVASAGFARVALEDVELSGVLIRAGDAVLVSEPSANRDEEVFDHPEEIDFKRPSNPHVAFGYGVHHCLGAPLARLELQVAIDLLLRRFPGLYLAGPVDQVPWKDQSLAHGVRALPVKW